MQHGGVHLDQDADVTFVLQDAARFLLGEFGQDWIDLDDQKYFALGGGLAVVQSEFEIKESFFLGKLCNRAGIIGGKYNDEIPDNATFAEGDWNSDGDFTSADLVVAFGAGRYEQGPMTAVSADRGERRSGARPSRRTIARRRHGMERYCATVNRVVVGR